MISDPVPELPDITVYIEALEKRILGRTLARVQITGPSLLRTVQPHITSIEGKKVLQLGRVGKRIAIGLEDDLWLVLHLMISGRLRWQESTSKTAKLRTLASFVFNNGTLSLTEAGSRKRASLHLVEGKEALGVLDPGGMEVLQANLESFTDVLRSASHTLTAEVSFVQYEGEIAESVIGLMQNVALAKAVLRGEVFYGVIDREDTRRLRLAYPKAF
jgi:formamidopyrimidine-DNA glycosylase